ncbi:MAG: C40 family peptidase [Sediminibacterium sp.]|nr:C40 family peptidase [Sediminibacterium sp.]
MEYGICTLSVVPCRKEPSGASEMVTQLLFGDYYEVLEKTEDWVRIKIKYDAYECWLSVKQHTSVPEKEFFSLQNQPPALCNELIQILSDPATGLHFPITIGAVLPNYEQGKLRINDKTFTLDGSVYSFSKPQDAEHILKTAYLFLNAPYLWGGKSPFGIDCSGFTQLVFKLNGYTLPRDAYQQVECGTPLSFVDEAQAGDLAFFDNEEGRIVHVGILLDNQQIIHASGCVRIDKFDHYGIFHSDRKKYSHTLRVIKRVLP